MNKRKGKKGKTPRPLVSHLHIFCEGTKSEPNYLRLYKELFCQSSPLIKIEPRSHTDPKGLVDEAIAARRKNLVSFPEDEYWVVYDRESPNKYPNETHEEAMRKARDAAVHVALSNVCFEVWLLLHKTNHDLCCNTYDELSEKELFKKHFPKYAKGEQFTNITKKLIAEAVNRASAMNRRTLNGADRGITEAEPYKLNPYTMFPELLSAIFNFYKTKGVAR